MINHLPFNRCIYIAKSNRYGCTNCTANQLTLNAKRLIRFIPSKSSFHRNAKINGITNWRLVMNTNRWYFFSSHLHSFRSMSIINYRQYPNISAVGIVRRNRYLARYWHSMPIQHCWMKWLSAANTSFLSKSTPNWQNDLFRVRCMLVDNAFVFNELSGSCLIVCLCWKTCLHFFRKKNNISACKTLISMSHFGDTFYEFF